MISCPSVSRSAIRTHYELSTVFYRLLWGAHIHHGYWEGDESPAVAQVQLTERLADRAGISAGHEVVDIGCGMGGSSIHLARTRGCLVKGVTISSVQRMWAATAARLQGVAKAVTFQCIDAEQVSFPAAAVDVVWSVECTEHLFDKPAFFEKAASWLKPGGRIAICAWLAGEDLGDPAHVKLVSDVCEGFFCPSLGSRADYSAWMRSAGLELESFEDWTKNVSRTWEICRDRVHRMRIRWIARMLDRDQVLFLDRFETLLRAYETGAMQYGCFIARRP
jgi:tocopherol O-methyltransferase